MEDKVLDALVALMGQELIMEILIALMKQIITVPRI